MSIAIFFFFNDTATTEIYTLSLHDALPISLFELLAENPDQRALLQADPSLIPAAVEEVLCLITPLQLTARTTSREVTLHGVTMPAGSRVVLIPGAANRDERQFPDPDRFAVTRPREIGRAHV